MPKIICLFCLGPYKIPKGTSIQSGLYFIMNDPAHFKDPEVFNPDRFIDSRTGKFVHDETVVPFGMGKRNCLGQALGEQVEISKKKLQFFILNIKHCQFLS